jgi:hypothetical protein
MNHSLPGERFATTGSRHHDWLKKSSTGIPKVTDNNLSIDATLRKMEEVFAAIVASEAG